MRFVYSDGGRSQYFKAEKVGDCVCRAICNATGEDYKKIYDLLSEKGKSARNGVSKDKSRKLLKEMGWTWHPTMTIGSGCKVHLKEDELPKGVLIVSVSKHLTCIKDGVIYDTYDCSRGETRCVYGYYTKD